MQGLSKTYKYYIQIIFLEERVIKGQNTEKMKVHSMDKPSDNEASIAFNLH
jgi:hypothetical protein